MSFDHTIKKATTSKIVEVMLRDSSTGAGKTSIAHGDVTASYVREAGTRTAITVASGSAGDSYSSGKWAAVDASNTPGLYQLHLPDAALAAGANAVTVFLKASGVIDKVIRISLIDADLRNSTSLGLTNLSTAVSTPPTASAIADAVLDEALSGHTGSGSLGKAIGDGVSAWVTATGFNTTTPPTAGAIADAVLDEALSGHTSSGTLGKAIGDGVTAWVTATGFNTTTPPTVGAIADAVLDEALSGHTGSGSLGKAIGDGVSAWVTATGFNTTTPPTTGAIADAVLDEALSGHTSSGTLGKAIGDGVTAWVTATGFNTTTPPTTAAIADAVLDEALSGHTSSGSLGKAIGDGVSAWVTATGFNTTTPPTVSAIADAVLDEALSGHTSSGTLGKAIGDGVSAWVTANIGSLNNLSASDVNAQVDAALADIHLDHLLAVDYDPSSKPGVATALLNELVQNDSGVSQFTVNALERAPSGGGGGGSAVGSGSTSHEVTINAGGNPQDGAEVYVTTDSAGTNVVAGTLHTNALGKATFQLDAATYYLWVQKAGVNFTNPTSFTVS